jgi:small GTP-binding protein
MIKSKVVFCGDLGVGKSTIHKRLFQQDYDACYHTTLYPYISEIFTETKTLSIWDLPGEVSPEKIPPAYLLNAEKICYVIDISKPKNFDKVQFDIQYFSKNFTNSKLLILANKSDLICSDELKNNLSLLTCTPNVLFSAKTTDGLEQLYNMLIAD